MFEDGDAYRAGTREDIKDSQTARVTRSAFEFSYRFLDPVLGFRTWNKRKLLCVYSGPAKTGAAHARLRAGGRWNKRL